MVMIGTVSVSGRSDQEKKDSRHILIIPTSFLDSSDSATVKP